MCFSTDFLSPFRPSDLTVTLPIMRREIFWDSSRLLCF